MLSRKGFLLVAAAGLLACHAQAADVTVKLGSTERVTRLFAYPNNCNVICYRDWTLEQTAEHYLRQSLQRDGYDTAKVTLHREQQEPERWSPAQSTNPPETETVQCCPDKLPFWQS